MITCPACHSLDVCGLWEQNLHDPVWRCRACEHTWPVRAGDCVAQALKAADRAAIDGIVEICREAKWSDKR